MYFYKGLKDCRLLGLFIDDGTVGMLETTDHQLIEMVSPYLGDLADICCGYFGTESVTSISLKFVEMVY